MAEPDEVNRDLAKRMLGYKATAEATISQNARLRDALRDVADLHRASEMARKRYRESYCEHCSHHLATNSVMGTKGR